MEDHVGDVERSVSEHIQKEALSEEIGLTIKMREISAKHLMAKLYSLCRMTWA